MNTALSMGVVLGVWLVVAPACMGMGSLVLRAWKVETKQARPAELFWLGFCALIASLQIIHLFLPINWAVTLGVVVVGLGACLPLRPWTWKPLLAFAVLFGLTALWIANRSLGFARNYDSGLYHFAAIRWANEFPVVPGLANLHSRLGFNQSYFLFVAFLNASPWFNEGYHVANGLLVVMLFASVWEAVLSALKRLEEASAAHWLLVAVLPFGVLLGLSGNVSSPSPDLAVAVCGVVVLHSLLKLDSSTRRALLVFGLVAVGCTLKLSFAPFALVVAGVALWGNWRWKLALGIGCLVLVPFAVRGVILSGYPLFPAALGGPWGEWAVPRDALGEAAAKIKGWARMPGPHWNEALHSWAWLPAWWDRVRHLPVFFRPLVVATGLAGVALCRLWPQGLARAALPPLAGLGAWFLLAPDPRFADWLVWLLLGVLVAVVVAQNKERWLAGRLVLAASFAVAACLLLNYGSLWRYGFAPMREAETKRFQCVGELSVMVPADEQADQLWNAPLPSTPEPKANLELRGAGLRDGFRIAR